MKQYSKQLTLAMNTLIGLFSKFWLIVSITFVLTALSIVFVLVVEPRYQAVAVVFPNTEQSFDRFSGITSLVGMMGMNKGSEGIYSTYYYPTLVKSFSLVDNVLDSEIQIDDFKGTVYDYLKEYQQIEKRHEAVTYIQEATHSENDFDSGIFKLQVETSSPILAKILANLLIDKLDEFNTRNRSHAVAKTMSHLTQRIDDAKKQFEADQEEYLDFVTRHQTNNLSPAAESKLAQLNSKREISKDIYINLLRQRELNEIEITKNYPVLTVIDSAQVPIEKSFPKRKQIVIFTFMLSFLFACFLSLLIYNYESNSIPEQKQKELKEAFGSIFHGSK